MTGFDRVATIASAVTLLGVLLSCNANAQTVTTGQYRHPQSENDMNFNKAYLAGIRDGLIAYNTSTDDKLFCRPGYPLLTLDQANDIVMHWANKKSIDADKLPLGLVLLYGLKETFPCPK